MQTLIITTWFQRTANHTCCNN